MMECDHITVVSEGLMSQSKMKPEMWTAKYIGKVLTDEYIHTIRQFDTVTVDGLPTVVEKDEMISMKPCDHARHMQQRQRVLGLGEEPTLEEKMMDFTNSAHAPQSINVETTCLYILDLDIKKLLPKMHTNFLEFMRMPGVLPGGTHCMMSAVCIKQLWRKKLHARYSSLVGLT